MKTYILTYTVDVSMSGSHGEEDWGESSWTEERQTTLRAENKKDAMRLADEFIEAQNVSPKELRTGSTAVKKW